MKKSIKLTLAITISLALYIGLFFLLTKTATPEKYAQGLWMFILSVVAGIIAIPVGIVVSWFLKKKKVDEKKSNIIRLVIAIIYGFLFGWLSLSGMVIGEFIMEK